MTHRGSEGDLAPAITGHSNRQDPNHVGLVNNHQHPSAALQLREHGSEFRFILRQGVIVKTFTHGVQSGGVMGAPSHRLIGRQSRHPMPHPRYEETAAPQH